MKKVILFGASAVACETYTYLTYDSAYEVAGFTVDGQYIKERTLFSCPVVPFESVETAFPPSDYHMLIAIGFQRTNGLRSERYRQAKAKGYTLINYISSKAVTWPGTVVGDNCIISPNTMISPSAKIGNDVLIGPGCVVAHDNTIGDHCFVGSGVSLSGVVTIEAYCFIGTGATVRDNVTIGRQSIIGAGALILENTPDKSVYLGKCADVLPIASDKLSLVR